MTNVKSVLSATKSGEMYTYRLALICGCTVTVRSVNGKQPRTMDCMCIPVLPVRAPAAPVTPFRDPAIGYWE